LQQYRFENGEEHSIFSPRVARWRLADSTLLGFVAAVAALCTSTTAAFPNEQSKSAPTYRFVVDYYNFHPNGTFVSKQRIAGDYRRNDDGTVEWSNVNIATASALDAPFGPAQQQAYMNGFRYRPSGDLLFKPEFFRDFPATATQAKNLVWDTHMFETFAKQVEKLTETPYRLPPSEVPLAGSGTFRNANVELTRACTFERGGQRLTVVHYEAFFNRFNLDLPGMKLVGRSDYWGDIWVLPATTTVERATLFEEVIGELHVSSQPNPQIVSVVRRGSFERIGQ
jgi:hypothetical protein